MRADSNLILDPLILVPVIGVIAGLGAFFYWKKKRGAARPHQAPSNNLQTALSKTRAQLSGLWGKRSQSSFNESRDLLEETLITADFGLKTTQELLENVAPSDALESAQQKIFDQCISSFSLGGQYKDFWDKLAQSKQRPYVLMLVGVNGVGKTTTIGKLASLATLKGFRVMIAAGDTFRAAASEQLKTWATRASVDFISRGEGADSASVLFDALTAAKARGHDLVICDTAGRLHSKKGLMDELSKCIRVLKKAEPEAPHDTWIVVDATTGQNAVNQVREFHEAVNLSGCVLTKLDGTAKGGIVVAIAREFHLPVVFIGIGEKVDDLIPFDPLSFVKAILPLDPSAAPG